MEHRYYEHWEHEEYRIIECIDCGFKHVYPIPDEESVKGFYDEKYYSNVKPTDYKSVSEDFIKKKSEAVNTDKVYGDIFEKVVEYKKCTNTKMVDIGSGNDLLALYFKNKGWEVCTIEPNIMAAGYLKSFDLPVINDYIENISLKNKSISFINVQFVLEHLKDPTTFLKKSYEILSTGGIIRVCVPNDFSEGQMAFAEYYNEKCRWVVLPDHINYFSYNSLSNLLSKTGFREIYRTANFPLEVLLMGGMNYYSEERYKELVGPLIDNFENSLKNTERKQLLDKLYEELSKIGLGRSIYMYAIKE